MPSPLSFPCCWRLPARSPLAAQEAAPARHAGGEAALVLPDLAGATFLGGINGRTLLLGGLIVCALGLGFGLMIYRQLKAMEVHRSMLEVSELIYETCKTYLQTQGRFLLVLWVFIGVAVAVYFGKLATTIDPATGAEVHGFPLSRVVVILLFSLIGMAGSYGVAWFGIRVNTFANSRTAFASLRGKPYPCYQIPLKAGMSIGMLLISVELVLMLCILLFIPGDVRGSVLHRVRDRRIAGRGRAPRGGRHLHQDRRHRRRPDEDRVQDQGGRRAEPRRDRGLHRRQRGRLGRPLGRRLRDLRRHRRRADLVHPAGRQRPGDPAASCWCGSSPCAS